jgi:hypothetical protein
MPAVADDVVPLNAVDVIVVAAEAAVVDVTELVSELGVEDMVEADVDAAAELPCALVVLAVDAVLVCPLVAMLPLAPVVQGFSNFIFISPEIW